ncbi:hypothetical protein J8273_1499 [Carpediemonas membranifera]|uniref:Uncharacterized protein n=1 Tax=Carpediemonas membranifera TaxID=201153 RepID=A0A8J6E466_9EUKA|nr:hypothetical protein J8273_1499 [Carpediemonas membranifera]|eukprot:KAG9396506.1 hypothetical protein J8273_1499 [Carpediemonas membranifera]
MEYLNAVSTLEEDHTEGTDKTKVWLCSVDVESVGTPKDDRGVDEIYSEAGAIIYDPYRKEIKGFRHGLLAHDLPVAMLNQSLDTSWRVHGLPPCTFVDIYTGAPPQNMRRHFVGFHVYARTLKEAITQMESDNKHDGGESFLQLLSNPIWTMDRSNRLTADQKASGQSMENLATTHTKDWLSVSRLLRVWPAPYESAKQNNWSDVELADMIPKDLTKALANMDSGRIKPSFLPKDWGIFKGDAAGNIMDRMTYLALRALRDLARGGIALDCIRRFLRHTAGQPMTDTAVIAAFLDRLSAERRADTLIPNALRTLLDRSSLPAHAIRHHVRRAIMLGHEPVVYLLMTLGHSQGCLDPSEVQLMPELYLRRVRRPSGFGVLNISPLQGFTMKPTRDTCPTLLPDTNDVTCEYMPVAVWGHRLDHGRLRLLVSYPLNRHGGQYLAIIRVTDDTAKIACIKDYLEWLRLVNRTERPVDYNGVEIRRARIV